MYDPYWQYFEYLRQELEKVQEENRALRTQLETIKPVHIDQMVYKIQELNIQTLSGVLNLGLSLNGEGEHFSELAERIVAEEGISVELGKKEQVNYPPPDNDEFPDSTI
jgi:spore germination protein PC